MRIIDLLPRGPIAYQEVDALQRLLHGEVLAGADDVLILAEFTPTWTAGRHTRPEDIPDSSLPVIHTDRAGSATWHGPGQLVVYPIVKLREPVDAVAWIRSVEGGVLGALRSIWNIPAVAISGRAGAWIVEGDKTDRKICAIGLKIARAVTLHGLALNVNIDPQVAFSGIIPCGLTDADVTSLDQEGVDTTVSVVARRMVPALVHSIDSCLERPGTPLVWEDGAADLQRSAATVTAYEGTL